MSKKPEKKMVTQSKNKNRERVFKLIALLLPFLFFIAFELILRLFGYGYDLSLFNEYKDDNRFYVLNNKIGLKYFSNEEDSRVGNHDIFLKEKSANTYRIFILGASSSFGFPYRLTTTFDRSVKYQLMQLFPEKNFEVVNLSITAVNSYTLLDFAKQLEDYDPDMVFVYAGHNEYYGALGVGSTSNIGKNRKFIQLTLKLRNLKLTQLFRNILSKGKKDVDASSSENRPLMERMAAMQSIGFESEGYYEGIEQYRANMDELCSIFSKLNVPVLYSTIIGNEKDLKPMISADEPKENSADYQFQLANTAYKNGNYTLAKEKYIFAKELDLLRFRAPAKINETIRDLSAKYENVYLVDAEEFIRNQIQTRILGKEVILEHVHPNLYGHRLISYSFINTLKANQFISDNWPSSNTIRKIRMRIPFSKVDSIRGEYITVMMKEGWPFNEPIPEDFIFGNSFEEKLAYDVSTLDLNWQESTNKLRNHYFEDKNYAELRKVLENQATIFSYDVQLNIDAGRANAELKDYTHAIFFYKKAISLKPDPSTIFSLAIAYLKSDRPEESLRNMEILVNDYNSAKGQEGISLIQPIVDLRKQLIVDSTNVSLMLQIAENYLGFNYNENALKYVEMALAEDKNCKECHEMLQTIKDNTGE
jgi:tetratricopeptide (TPR) repeat protein